MENSPLVLDFHKIPSNPFHLMQEWISVLKSIESDHIYFGNACLSTQGLDGYPDSRMMSLKGISEDNIVFTTPLVSRKAQQLQENPRAALNFHWNSLGAQIRIRGDVIRISDEEADELFENQELRLKRMVWASRQSEPIKDLQEYRRKYSEINHQFKGKKIPRPQSWGGFRLKAISYEFWLMTRRVFYRKQNNTWFHELLQP